MKSFGALQGISMQSNLMKKGKAMKIMIVKGICKCFFDSINNMNIVDFPLVGRKFIWVKGDIRTMRRLDIIVFNYCVVVLSENQQDWGLKPFRILNAWFKDKEF
ncbi:hypothetical protein Lal_00031605 [Lupinus albus]|nr:hypothetical protein Lal_00031605 [Lupinus albus]